MSNEFVVVGEYRTDDQWLLVLGADEKYYSYHPKRKRLVQVNPDERWLLYAEDEAAVVPRSRTEPLATEAPRA